MDLPVSRSARFEVVSARSGDRYRSGMPQDLCQQIDTMEAARHGFDPQEVAVYFRGMNGRIVHKKFLDLRLSPKEQIVAAWESFFKRFPRTRTEGSTVTLCHE